MSLTQTILGKAFEYACLKAILDKLLEENKQVEIIKNNAYNTANLAYMSLSQREKENYDLAAHTAMKIIVPLEPRLLYEDSDIPLFLSISSDSAAKGKDGDVRDVICLRSKTNWEIGFSCKHNHQALKHPRITEAKDFGKAWLGYPCSKKYIQKIEDILNPIQQLQKDNVNWQDVPDKISRFYVPILEAIICEFKDICSCYEDVPQKLLSYFFGSKDFYKIISLEKDKQTKVVAFNMQGTLNVSSSKEKSLYKIKKLQYPTRLVDIRFKKNGNTISKTTISIIFDQGWQISMRLHNADKRIKMTGLKFDVQLIGQPNDVYQQQRSWFE